MGGFNSGRRATTPDTDDCIRVSLADLRQANALRRGVMARRYKDSYLGDQRVASLAIVADIDCLEPVPCLHITGIAYGRRIDQRVPLVAQPQPFGGERWFAVCPITGWHCTVLVLPPSKTIFASVAGWGVPYASSRERKVDRALRAIDKLERQERGMSKYVRHSTRNRMMVMKAAARAVIDGAERKMMGDPLG